MHTLSKHPLRTPRRSNLALTLAVTLAVKCLALYGLWYACFSHPQTKHMLLPAGQVERHLFAIPAARDPLPTK
ncbi:cytochrome oxidase putative small subunit CydP [Massilia phyllosphaerae]|uniref:cytochrome oxidase putative small subunit CydP n=1 Tax=Massilia phyllosphaerae TaxID=3106034 RepID=UPI002B1CC841|nr:cytochrome oxidase putative small subunit CydP [Massilia sp. SGZ-792]